MEEFYLHNENLRKLLNEKFKEVQPTTFDKVKRFFVEKFSKNNELVGSYAEQDKRENQLETKIRACYRVNVDKLCYMVSNALAEHTPFSPVQPDNKWKNEYLELPIKKGKNMITAPFECIYYGGTYKKSTNKNLEEAFDETLKWVERDQLYIVRRQKNHSKTVDVSPREEEWVKKTRIDNRYEYPMLRYNKENVGLQNHIIYNIMDNLVAENLVEAGVLDKYEVMDALAQDKLEIPSQEEAATREIHYLLKDATEKNKTAYEMYLENEGSFLPQNEEVEVEETPAVKPVIEENVVKDDEGR